jgi:hypothetical protein
MPTADLRSSLARSGTPSAQHDHLPDRSWWDVAGTLHAGATAAFAARPGMILDPLVPGSDVVGSDLAEVAALILEADADR